MTDDLFPAQQIARLIAGQIIAGELGEGEPIPTVRSLAQTYGVATATAGQAHQRLKAKGLVEKKGNRIVVAQRQKGDILELVQDALMPINNSEEITVARYEIDGVRQEMHATGIVEPVMRWVENRETGRREESNAQDMSDQGVPLWRVEVFMSAENWGKEKTEVARVVVPSTTEPVIEKFARLAFDGLSVIVSVKNGQIRETWMASGIRQGK